MKNFDFNKAGPGQYLIHRYRNFTHENTPYNFIIEVFKWVDKDLCYHLAYRNLNSDTFSSILSFNHDELEVVGKITELP